MKIKRIDWDQDIAIALCLFDPRVDEKLRKKINAFLVDKYLLINELISKPVSPDVVFDKDTIISKIELPDCEVNYIAANPNDSHVRHEIVCERDRYLKSIKLATKKALLSGQFDLDSSQIPESIVVAAKQYWEDCKKEVVSQKLQIESAFTEAEIARNCQFIQQEVRKVVLKDEDLNTPVSKLFLSSIGPEEAKTAFICTTVGRPKRNYPNRQEDRAGVFSDFCIDRTWEHCIPKLLIRVIQRLILEIYENIPLLDYSNPIEDNCSYGGSTLTLVLSHLGSIYTIFIGDSPAVYFSKAQNVQIMRERWLTWSHHVGDAHGQKAEKDRVEKAGGKINEDNRVKHEIGSLAVSQAIGDFAVKGVGGVGSVSEIKRDLYVNEEFVVLGTDGMFDVLSIADILKLAENVLLCDLAKACCTEAYRNRNRRDNITAVVMPLNSKVTKNSTVAFVADGHGTPVVAEYIKQNLERIFKELAMSPVPESIPIHSNKMHKTTADGFRRKELVRTQTRFSLSQSPMCSVYNAKCIVDQIKSDSNYVENVGKTLTKELKKKLLYNEVDYQITQIEESGRNCFVFWKLSGNWISSITCYVPTMLPMTYDEYDQIKNTKWITSINQLAVFLSNLKSAKFEEEETLTLSL